MTLQQAHEIQRKELMSLRAKAAVLKNNHLVSFPTRKRKLSSAISDIWNKSIKQRTKSTPLLVATGKTITKQIIDISIHVNVRDYIADEYRNRLTGTRLHAPFPAGIVNDVNYGASIKALALLLNNYYNVPIAKTKQYLSDITKGVISLSTGTICNLCSEFSASTEPERAKIFSSLTHSDILYSDATVSNINGKRKAVILCTDKNNVQKGTEKIVTFLQSISVPFIITAFG